MEVAWVLAFRFRGSVDLQSQQAFAPQVQTHRDSKLSAVLDFHLSYHRTGFWTPKP